MCVSCVLSDCDLRDMRAFESCTQCCDIQSLWRGKWVIVGLEEENLGKKGDSHRGITDHWHISAVWYLTDMIVWLQRSWHWYIFCSRWLSLSNAQSCSLYLQLKKLHFVKPDNIICHVSEVYSFKWELLHKYWQSRAQPKERHLLHTIICSCLHKQPSPLNVILCV